MFESVGLPGPPLRALGRRNGAQQCFLSCSNSNGDRLTQLQLIRAMFSSLFLSLDVSYEYDRRVGTTTTGIGRLNLGSFVMSKISSYYVPWVLFLFV